MATTDDVFLWILFDLQDAPYVLDYFKMRFEEKSYG